MAIAGITDFFQEIVRDLHSSLYLAIGGTLEEEGSRDWTAHAVELTSTSIKILILLVILGFFLLVSNLFGQAQYCSYSSK